MTNPNPNPAALVEDQAAPPPAQEDQGPTRLNGFDLDPDAPLRVGRYLVEVMPDEDVANPWRDSDGMTPAAWFSLQRYGVRVEVEDQGDDILDPFAHVSAAWVSRHWRALCDALGLDQDAHNRDARDLQEYNGGGLGESRLESFRQALDDIKGDSWGPACDWFAALESVYRLIGWPVLDAERHGFSQGDSLRVLLVATPAHAARWGVDLARPDILKSLEREADTLGAWAFGNAWGYRVTVRKTGEEVDSCWGFLGDYHDRATGLLEEVESAIDSDRATRARRKALKVARKEAAARLAEYVVPLAWARFLLEGDAQALAQEDQAEALAWAGRLPGPPVSWAPCGSQWARDAGRPGPWAWGPCALVLVALARDLGPRP